jgi:hypothetical protein
MLVLYKPNIDFLSEHAVDPDKRRYAVTQEGPRHYIDIDHYGNYPYAELPRKWNDAVARYGEDSLTAYGIVPWHIQIMLQRLTAAFKEKNFYGIMKNSAEIGHYIADSHVPLHANTNHNGQYSNQRGIHGFWESRVPELLADKEFDFFIGKAEYIKNPAEFIWARVLESGKASDSVLRFEKELTQQFPPFIKDFFEAFAGSKKKFTNGVLANIENNDVWRVGFITQEDMGKFEMVDFVAVYVPMAYSVAGNVYIIPRSRIRPITNISSVQTMKFAVSGGVTDIAEENKNGL